MNEGTLNINYISQNPFRILGAYANTSKKELSKNINKINAFLGVGKNIDFPLDNIVSLDNCNRSKESTERAQKAIERSIDALKAAMFWFINVTPIDKIAFNHVKAGDLEKAIEIWSKVENVSSLQNRTICYLIMHRWKEAAISNDCLFTRYAKEFCSLIDDTLDLSTNDLINTFFECISNSNQEILMKFYDSFSVFDDDLGYEYVDMRTSGLWQKSLYAYITKPIIKDLETKVADARVIPHEDALQRKEAAKHLLKNSKLHYVQLLGDDSPEYVSIATKVVSTALQCIIDYYNHSSDPDNVAMEAKDLAESALFISPKGSMIRQRCEDNLKKLEKICSELPPKEVSYYHKLLKKRINSYSEEPATIENANQFILDCVPYLMSIRAILGLNDKYYIRISTRVAADALGDIISSYNAESDNLFARIDTATGLTKSILIAQVKKLIKDALIAAYRIKLLDLDASFRTNRLNGNYDAIFNQAKDARVLGASSSSLFSSPVSDSDVNDALREFAIDKRNEKAYADNVNSTSDCKEYIRIFPGGRYTKEVQGKMERFAYNECKTFEDLEKFKKAYPNTSYDLNAKHEEITFASCKSISDYKSYVSTYPSGKYLAEAKRKIDELSFKACKSLEDYQQYIKNFPSGNFRHEAERKIETFIFNKCKTLSDYELYIAKYPHGTYLTRAKSWIEEENLWQQCKAKDKWKLYKEFISKFPRGRYASEARPKAKSPGEKFKEWRSENGCLLTIIIVAIIAFGIAAITNGVTGIGYVLAGIAFLGFCTAGGKGDIGCAPRLIGLGVAALAGFLAYIIIPYGEQLEKDKKASTVLESLSDNPTMEEYRTFFNEHSSNVSSQKLSELSEQYYRASLDSCYASMGDYSEDRINGISGLGYLKSFANFCRDENYKIKAESKISEIVDSLYSVAKKKNSYEGWEAYQKAVPSDEYRDSEDKKQAKDVRWATEANAWASAQELDNTLAYQRYLSLFPHGAHKAAADKRLIDLEVESTFAGSHGSLPAMDQTGYGGPISHISVYNNTEYTLTLLYSGTESKRLVISPHSHGSVRIKNGVYRIAASVNAANVSRYGGTETLNGGSYEVEYYISTTSYPY